MSFPVCKFLTTPSLSNVVAANLIPTLSESGTLKTMLVLVEFRLPIETSKEPSSSDVGLAVTMFTKP